jgi:hypothetical protein
MGAQMRFDQAIAAFNRPSLSADTSIRPSFSLVTPLALAGRCCLASASTTDTPLRGACGQPRLPPFSPNASP